MRVDHGRHDFVGVERDGGERPQQGALLLKAIDRPLAGRLVKSDVGDLIAPGRRQGQIVLEASQFIATAS